MCPKHVCATTTPPPQPFLWKTSQNLGTLDVSQCPHTPRPPSTQDFETSHRASRVVTFCLRTHTKIYPVTMDAHTHCLHHMRI